MSPLEILRHHVSGAIYRGEAQAIKAKPARYSVNRCNHWTEPMENLYFERKADAMKWARGTNHATVRMLNNERTVIFSR
jgi:hypothetical protein